jgi:hypothetical protein
MVVGGFLMLISALVSWNVGLLLTGAICVTWAVPKFLSFWRDEEVELPVPAVVLRIVLPLAAVLIIAASAGAWLLGAVFAGALLIGQALYLFVLRPKHEREHRQELPPWWR